MLFLNIVLSLYYLFCHCHKQVVFNLWDLCCWFCDSCMLHCWTSLSAPQRLHISAVTELIGCDCKLSVKLLHCRVFCLHMYWCCCGLIVKQWSQPPGWAYAEIHPSHCWSQKGPELLGMWRSLNLHSNADSVRQTLPDLKPARYYQQHYLSSNKVHITLFCLEK